MRALALSLALLMATPALAHKLVIYAYADAGELVVEAKFSNGNTAKLGEIRVLDAASTLLTTVPLDDDGETRLPLPEGGAAGVTIEVETDAGHQDYWILTPADLGAEG